MQKNVGTIDRIVRVVLAVILGALILNGALAGTWAWVLGLLAIIFLITSAVSFCPLYLPIGLCTRKETGKG